MKGTINLGDEIELVDENNGLYARIRVRERVDNRKASIFLTPDQLVEHAHDCIVLARAMRHRR